MPSNHIYATITVQTSLPLNLLSGGQSIFAILIVPLYDPFFFHLHICGVTTTFKSHLTRNYCRILLIEFVETSYFLLTDLGCTC